MGDTDFHEKTANFKGKKLMNECSYNLVNDRLISIVTRDNESRKVSIPELLVLLARNEVVSLPAAQAFHVYPIISFMIQLAYHCLATCDPIPTEDLQCLREDFWRERLRFLGDNRDEPWCVFVADKSLPAFLQPPIDSNDDLSNWGIETTPDAIDVLNLSKNHDVKLEKMTSSNIEHWVCSLISCQTMSGFFGRGNYGICRMNGGFSSRPFVGFVDSFSHGARFLRDVHVLLEGTREVAEKFGFRGDGKRLLWLEPWDGKTSLPLIECAPHFLEICRRLRMRKQGNGWAVGCRPTESSRVQEANGEVGDPWIPIERTTRKALTIGGRGLDFGKITEILWADKYVLGQACMFRPGDKYFYASVLVRGQGETQGYHERVLPIPEKVRSKFRLDGDNQSLGKLARDRVLDGEKFSKSIASSIIALVQGKIDGKAAKAAMGYSQECVRKFEKEVDTEFFERLWDESDWDPERAALSWRKFLLASSQKILKNAQQAFRGSNTMEFRNISVSNRIFFGMLRKNFPDLFQKEENIQKDNLEEGGQNGFV